MKTKRALTVKSLWESPHHAISYAPEGDANIAAALPPPDLGSTESSRSVALPRGAMTDASAAGLSATTSLG